jgi:hypothetical protein
MRQRLAIIITIAIVLIVLVGLNAASYVRIEKVSDLESDPDRSTYNAGATGTRALYEFLDESGRKVIRWTEEPMGLLNQQEMQQATLIIVGETAIPIKEEEATNILNWVSKGGYLVVIDRNPNPRLLPPAGLWGTTTQIMQYPSGDLQADNPDQLTEGVKPMRAGQPSLLTRNVESVMPSRFAGIINFYLREDDESSSAQAETPVSQESVDELEGLVSEPSPTPKRPSPSTSVTASAQEAVQMARAPVAHVYDDRGALLIDYPHGAGKIVVLSDPFIVANNGISRADNLQLALNAVAGRGGLIIFDEYHQGHAAARNRLFAYFAGTPAIAMFAQFGLIVVAIIWTRGRRFGRPLPLPHVDRRSKLEYVASMAELQQRSGAYDLAIENIYARTRRALARFAGVDNMTPRGEIAARVAARSKIDRQKLESLMRDCESAINGEAINGRQSLALVASLREVERALGLRMRTREIRQARQQGTTERV